MLNEAKNVGIAGLSRGFLTKCSANLEELSEANPEGLNKVKRRDSHEVDRGEAD